MIRYVGACLMFAAGTEQAAGNLGWMAVFIALGAAAIAYREHA